MGDRGKPSRGCILVFIGRKFAPFPAFLWRVLGFLGSSVRLRDDFAGRFQTLRASAPPEGDMGRASWRGKAQNHTQK